LYVDRLAEPHKSDVAEIINERGWGIPDQSWLPGHDKLEG